MEEDIRHMAYDCMVADTSAKQSSKSGGPELWTPHGPLPILLEENSSLKTTAS
jgi:hypothetical protein